MLTDHIAANKTVAKDHEEAVFKAEVQDSCILTSGFIVVVVIISTIIVLIAQELAPVSAQELMIHSGVIATFLQKRRGQL